MSEEVVLELERKDDEVFEWAKGRPHAVIQTDEMIQQVVRQILQAHPRLVDTRRNRSGADPFVIAVANLQGRTVVSNEAPTTKIDRPNIPDVCGALGIGCVDVLGLIRRENWRV